MKRTLTTLEDIKKLDNLLLFESINGIINTILAINATLPLDTFIMPKINVPRKTDKIWINLLSSRNINDAPEIDRKMQ